MSSFAKAVQAAHEAVSGQSFPHACLYMVATPIGNLADISLRALHVLAMADFIACEDTRHTQQLLRAYGIDKTSAQLLAVHQHNEHEGAQKVIDWLAQDKRIAYVSDAGTPGISDPGAVLAQDVQAAGYRILPLPGASSVITAISAAGLPPLSQESQGFVFAGFLPSKAKSRETAIAALAQEARAIVLLEAPHRITELAKALAVLGERKVTLARELTKQFEQITTLPAHEVAAWLAQDAMRCKGEFVVLLQPLAIVAEASGTVKAEQLLVRLLEEKVSLKSAVKIAAELSGQSRNALYDWALDWQKQSAQD